MGGSTNRGLDLSADETVEFEVDVLGSSVHSPCEYIGL
jgi:hypothetical protein